MPEQNQEHDGQNIDEENQNETMEIDNFEIGRRTNDKKFLAVLNIYALRHLVKYIFSKMKKIDDPRVKVTVKKTVSKARPKPKLKFKPDTNPICFIKAFVMCHNRATDMVVSQRQIMCNICREDLGYNFNFNKTNFKYNSHLEYDRNNKKIETSIQKTILALTKNMLDYIKVRRHVVVDNIVEFKNEVEQNENIEQFLIYFNEYKKNRKINVNSSLKYKNTLTHDKIYGLPFKEIDFNNIPQVLPTAPFQQNLFVLVLKKINEIKSSGESYFLTEQPVYDNYNDFVLDYTILKNNNFDTKTNQARQDRMVKYFVNLIYLILAIRTNSMGDADIYNNDKYLVIEKTLLQHTILRLSKNENNMRASINSKIYTELSKNKTLLNDILQQLFILLNYGTDAYGLFS